MYVYGCEYIYIYTYSVFIYIGMAGSGPRHSLDDYSDTSLKGWLIYDMFVYIYIYIFSIWI